MMAQSKPMAKPLMGTSFRSFNELFSAGEQQAQHFRLDPTRRTTIVGRKGIRLTFLPFALTDSKGVPILEEVDVHLREFFSQQDLIRSNLATTSEDRLMESGGQFYVDAVHHQEPLLLQKPLVIELPVLKDLRNVLAMKLFKGSRSTTRVLMARNTFDWQWCGSGSIKLKTINGRKYFRFEVPTFDWWSCGYFYNRRKPVKMVTAKYTGPFQVFDEQAAFLCFKKINSIVRMYTGIDRFTALNVPADLSATIIGVGLQEGQLFFGSTEISKIANRKFNLKLEPMSIADVEEKLDRLLGPNPTGKT